MPKLLVQQYAPAFHMTRLVLKIKCSVMYSVESTTVKKQKAKAIYSAYVAIP